MSKGDDISASGLQTAMLCPASDVLALEAKGPQKSKKAVRAADRGTAIHDFLYNCRSMKKKDALELVDEKYREECAKIPVSKLLDKESRGELAFSYNILTGQVRFLGENIGRDYEQDNPLQRVNGLRAEIPGTWDEVGEQKVVDWKTGWWPVPEPAENRQMQLGALCTTEHYQSLGCDVEIVYLRKGRRPEHVGATLTPFEIEDFRKELESYFARKLFLKQKVDAGAEIEARDVNPGDHCRFCKARKVCPNPVEFE